MNHLALRLLKCLGVQAGYGVPDPESFKEAKNPFFKASPPGTDAQRWEAAIDDWVRAVANNESTGTPTYIFANPDLGSGSVPIETIAPSLRRHGAVAARAFRANTLDRMICMIRDCFTKEIGYPTLDGVNSTLCFDRRSYKGPGEYQAHVVPTPLLNYDEGEDTAPGCSYTLDPDSRNNLRVRNATGQAELHPQPTELLNAAQLPHASQTGDLARSAKAWSEVLGDWRVPHTLPGVTACLAPLEGTYHASNSHRSTVENFDELAEAIAQSNNTVTEHWRWMLRDKDASDAGLPPEAPTCRA